MRGIVLHGDSRLPIGPSGSRGMLAPLLDRPFAQHVVEAIVRHGIREIHFILAPEDPGVERSLGDGSRWGAVLHYHFARNNPLATVKAIAADLGEERILLARADQLPLIDFDVTNCPPNLLCWRGDRLHWSGWAIAPASTLRELQVNLSLEDQLRALLGIDYKRGLEVGKPLSVTSYRDLLESNWRVLNREFPGLVIGGLEVAPGIRMCRNAKVHPSAILRSPVFLGEDVNIGPGVQLGPNVTIGKRCVVERDTHVVDSMLLRGTYVGEELVLREMVVDQSKLISTRWDAEIEGVDDLLAGSVAGEPLARQTLKLCSRVLAALLIVLSAPLMVLTYLASLVGWFPRLRWRQVIRTPTVRDFYRWKTFRVLSFGERQTPETWRGWMLDFLLHFLPGLFAVVGGKAHFLGSRFWSPDEAVMGAMAHGSSFLYGYPGLLQPSLFGETPMTNDIETGLDISWAETGSLLLRYARALAGLPIHSSLPNPAEGESRRFGI